MFTSQVDDLSPLTEIATSHPLALDVLSLAWLGNSAAAVASPGDKPFLRQKIDATIGALVSTFKGTDAVTLLNFLSHLLRNLDDEVRRAPDCVYKMNAAIWLTCPPSSSPWIPHGSAPWWPSSTTSPPAVPRWTRERPTLT